MCVIPKVTTWRAFKYQTSAFLKQYYDPVTQSVPLIVALSTATVSDVPPDEGLLYDKTAVTRDNIKGTLQYCVRECGVRRYLFQLYVFI